MWGRPSAGYAQEVIACPIAVNLSVCLCRAASTRSHKGSKASLSVMVENDDVAAFSGQRRTYTRSGESGKEGALRILSPMWSDHTMAHRHRPQSAGLCWRCFRRYPREQEDRPRRLRGATLTLRKSVTHSARFQVRDHFAARRRPAEKPDKLEARGRRGLEPMTGKMQVKKSWLRRTTRPPVGLRRRLASARSLSDPRPPTPRTDTWAIPVPHNCGGAAAAASRTSPRLTLRQ